MTSILDLIDQVQAPGNVFWTNLDKEILDLVTAYMKHHRIWLLRDLQLPPPLFFSAISPIL